MQSTDDPPTRSDQLPVVVWAAVVVIAIAPIVAAVVRALMHDWFPIGDNALLYVRVVDVLTHHHPWLGSWTSASLSVGENMNNPGPLYDDLLAPVAKLFGPGPGAAIGVGAANIASVLGISTAARRIGGHVLQGWALLAAAALSWSMGSEMLIDIWQAHALMLPFLLLLVLLVGVADGRTAFIPWALGVASLLVQTHISYAYILVILCPAAGVSYTLQRHGRPHAPWRSALRSRPALWSYAVVGSAWAQPLAEQFFGPGKGNLSRLIGNAGGGSLQVGPTSAAGITARVFVLPPWWLRHGFSTSVPSTAVTGTPGDPRLQIATLPRTAVAVLALATIVLVLAALATLLRRGAVGLQSRACVLAMVAVVSAFLSVSKLTVGPVGFAAHHVRFLWPLAVFVHVVLAWVIGELVVEWRPALRFWRSAAVATATAACAVAALPYYAQPQGPVADYATMPTLRRVFPRLGALRDVQPVLYDVSNLRIFEPYSSTVMMELQARGIEFRVSDEGMVRQLGEARRADGTERARIFQLQGGPAVLYDGDACRVVLASALSPAEEQAADVAGRALVSALSDGSIIVDRAALPDTDSSIFPVLDAAIAGNPSAARSLVFEGYLSRWLALGIATSPLADTDTLRSQQALVDGYVNSAYGLFSAQAAPCP